jgi:hypothetical protein
METSGLPVMLTELWARQVRHDERSAAQRLAYGLAAPPARVPQQGHPNMAQIVESVGRLQALVAVHAELLDRVVRVHAGKSARVG